MVRKDSEKDSERPHYYSQFWLDVAAGRRIIGTPKPGEEAEPGEVEALEPTPDHNTAAYKAQEEDQVRASADGRSEAVVHPVAEPLAAPDEYEEPEAEPEDLDYAADAIDDLDLQEDVEDADIPDMDLSPIDEEEEDEDFYDEEDEEDDIGWGGGRGRKKGKPSRPVKQPKKPRRDIRRGF